MFRSRAKRRLLVAFVMALVLFGGVLTQLGASRVLAPGSSVRALSKTWSGTWSSNWGTMSLTQTGSHVDGRYEHDQGHIAGTVSSDVLTGHWDEAPTRKGPQDAGTAILTMSADGKSFAGKWDYDGNPGAWSSDGWSGRCTGGPCAANSAVKTTTAATTTRNTTTTTGTAPKVVPPGPPNPVLHPAVQKTLKASSALMEFSVRVSSAKEIVKGVRSVTITGKGGIDNARKRSQLSISLGQLGALVKATEPIELRLIGKSLFVKLPASLMTKTPGKRWARFDQADASSAAGSEQGALANLDPRRTVAVIEGGSSVRKVGSGTVRGVRCTHYIATLDLARMTKSMQPARQELVPQVTKALGRSSVPVDVWVGTDGYVHRVSVDLSVVNSTTTPPSKVRLAFWLDVYGYGSKVDPKAPPASQVVDGSTMLKGISLGG